MLKATMKRVDKAYKDGQGPGHIMIVLAFALGFFLLVYFLAKFF